MITLYIMQEEERILKKQIGGGAEVSLDAAQHRARRRLGQIQEAEKQQFANKVNKVWSMEANIYMQCAAWAS